MFPWQEARRVRKEVQRLLHEAAERTKRPTMERRKKRRGDWAQTNSLPRSHHDGVVIALCPIPG